MFTRTRWGPSIMNYFLDEWPWVVFTRTRRGPSIMNYVLDESTNCE